jgi:hypothetical protein
MGEDHMARVRAKTFPSYEHSDDPTDPSLDEVREVEGELEVRHVPAPNYDQWLVNGEPVDPETVERIEEE